MHQEEEYTDYSCSTSIERLARDVETVLRAWHVDRGSDRHVSITAQHQPDEDSTSCLIRSSSIQWNVSLTTAEGRTSVVVDLEVALWDAPDAIVNEEDDNDDEPLVKSLRRGAFLNMPSHGFWFDNFSTLFGIGQHITLTPIQPEPVPAAIVESLGNSLLTRHNDQMTATWVLGSTLSGWLQTALNCAVSNCHCCIPAFGVWGMYRPDQLLPVHSPLVSNSKNGKQLNSSSFSDDNHSTSGLLGTTIQTKNSPVIRTGVQVFPKWVQAVRGVPLPMVGRKYRVKAQKYWNSHFVPPLVAGSLVCPSSLNNPTTSGTFWCSVTPDSDGASNIATNSRLTVWGSVLLQHCPDSTVILSGARHVFGWFKPRPPGRTKLFSTNSDEITAAMQEWRSKLEEKHSGARNELDTYRRECRDTALELLEEAWGAKKSKSQMWGPKDDPVACVYATTTWFGRSNDGIVEPLMQFPLRIRSRREMSTRDWIDMEESVERTILNPLSPSKFCIQAYYDRETSVATLAANQRCVLAALIRAATLPGETLLQHLADEALVSLWDDIAGTIVAVKLAERANVGTGTRQIVEAMDWSGIIEDMIDVWEAESIVHHVMDGSLTTDFPVSPEEPFSEKDAFHPFRKSAPWGRLLSVLFSHLAKVRALSSMALVWGVFVQELRRRWEARESLPNMQYIPGLDPHPLVLYEQRCFSTIGLKANFAAFLHCSEPDPDDFHCLIGQKLQVFNLGVESLVALEIAEHEAMERFLGAGEVPSSAPGTQMVFEPERRNSIATAETFVPGDIRDVGASPNKPGGRRKWPKSKEKMGANLNEGGRENYGPPTINTDLEFWVMDEPGHAGNMDQGFDIAQPAADDPSFDFIAPPPTNLDDLDLKHFSNGDSKRRKSGKQIIVEGLPDAAGAWEGTIMDGSDAGSVATSCSQSQAYYDAAEAGSIFSMKNGFVNLDTVVNVADMQRRPGARCPVHGVTYGSNGEQLYAPYLQRPSPLTDDLVFERRLMLSRALLGSKQKKGDLQYRIELAHRLQKPKLLSDMRAFKAANPNASFEDFTKWYGNPGSPLDDYSDAPQGDELSVLVAITESAAKKLDKASEAMKVLMSTRDFWSGTWEEAEPIPALEQKPLFDVASTVEMTLDYLEQMHPANLLNQVMAVNLSAAYFTIVSSADETLRVDIVQALVQRLHSKVENALSLLSRDATGGASNHLADGSSVDQASATSSQRYAADETIYACEEACNALGETETIIARALSLLHKFPGQYDLVQSLLGSADGSPASLEDERGRSSFLSAVHTQQQQHKTFATYDSLPKPVLREYVLRNIDDSKPCQLSVRFGDGGAYLDRVDNEGGVLLALSKSYND